MLRVRGLASAVDEGPLSARAAYNRSTPGSDSRKPRRRTVDVDHRRPITRPRASPPRARERLIEHPVELADVPEK